MCVFFFLDFTMGLKVFLSSGFDGLQPNSVDHGLTQTWASFVESQLNFYKIKAQVYWSQMNMHVLYFLVFMFRHVKDLLISPEKLF